MELGDGSVSPGFATLVHGTVSGLGLGNGYLYVTGAFDTVSALDLPNAARLSPSTGSPDAGFRPAPDGPTAAVAIDASGAAIFGGSFQGLHSFLTNVARIDLTTMQIDPSFVLTTDGTVRALGTDGTDLYVGGQFGNVDATTRLNLARVSTAGLLYGAFDPAPNGLVNALAYDGAEIEVGGFFSSIGGQARTDLARVLPASGAADTGFNAQLDGVVTSLAYDSPTASLYVGGDHTHNLGGTQRPYLLKMAPATDTLDLSFNPQPNQAVDSLFLDPLGLYVGGQFSIIGGSSQGRAALVDKASGNLIALLRPGRGQPGRRCLGRGRSARPPDLRRHLYHGGFANRPRVASRRCKHRRPGRRLERGQLGPGGRRLSRWPTITPWPWA